MKEYHKIWLKENSHLSEEWLGIKLNEGFDIHHIDGNHSNNKPENLSLIWHKDHMRLHGFNMNRMCKTQQIKGNSARIKRGERSYILKEKCPDTWDGVANILGCTKKTAISNAKLYANAEGREWPIESDYQQL